uniref:C-type lectin domain-containing protein n=1 Tax=Anabas testudineus TaxID=64144 RepID=A0A7N6B6Z6_ANATE
MKQREILFTEAEKPEQHLNKDICVCVHKTLYSAGAVELTLNTMQQLQEVRDLKSGVTCPFWDFETSGFILNLRFLCINCSVKTNKPFYYNLFAAPKCEEGWELHGGKCYYFSTSKSTWYQSRDYCRCKGGDLVKIDSREEQVENTSFLELRVRKKMNDDDDRFWIGLTDSKEEGKWLWVDDSPLNTSLTFWTIYEPNNWKVENLLSGEDCARMGDKREADDLKCWYDRSCLWPQKSICEKSKDVLIFIV